MRSGTDGSAVIMPMEACKALPFDWRQRVAGQLADGSVVRGCGTELLEEAVVGMVGRNRQEALVLHVASGGQLQSDNGAIGKAL